MMYIWAYTLVSVLIVSLLSLVGLFALSVKTERFKSVLFLLVSFAAGALFGDAFLHLLPEAVEGSGFTMGVSLLVIGGISLMFLVEKVIHWHHCHNPADEEEHVHPSAIMNLVGDGVHNLIDGLIIGATYLVSIPVGIATTLAVAFHEIPQEISDFGVLIHGGFSKGKALFYNFLSALVAVLGAIIALVVGGADRSGSLVHILLPVTAGIFIYVAGADLIPELHKEVKVSKSIGQFFAFLAGVGIMVLLLIAE